jgi:Big-like domain-containing protein/Ig-like domain-containing protein
MIQISRPTLAVLLVLLVCSPLMAATRTWTGSVSDRWSDPANWDGGVPAAGDDLVFPSNGRTASTNDLASETMFHSITVNAIGYRIGGNGIVLGAGGLILNAPFLVSLIHGELKFSSITLADSQTWRGQGNEFTRLGPTNINGKTLTITDSVRLDFDSISGTGAIIENAPNASVRSESSTFVGTVTVNAGPFSLGGTAGDVEITGRDFGGDDQVNSANASLELTAASVANVTVTGSGALSLHGTSGTSYAGSLAFLPAGGDPAWFVIADGSIPVACNVTGSVALGNALLVVRSSHNSAFTLIHNLGAGRVAGTFLGLPEGAVFGNGSWVRISYAGGGGNDVTLTPASTAFTATTTTITASILPSSPGQIVSFTAAVTSAAGTPAGNVNFYDGGILLGSSSLDLSGRAILTTSFDPGPHLFTAAYLGSEALATSQGSVRVAACVPPILTQQPASQSILQGQVVTLAVQTNATPPLSFQWYEGSSGDLSKPVPGATSRTFTPAPLTKNTSFWVKVSNDCGSVQSATATIGVRQPRRRTVSH